MTEYIIKSSVCLALLWAVYFILLEGERMHKFNRFFLLFGLCFSFLIPFVPIGVYHDVVRVSESFTPNVTSTASNTVVADVEAVSKPAQDYLMTVIVLIYSIPASFFLFRFLRNIYLISSAVWRHKTVSYEGAVLVLMPQPVMSHTFLNYIFVSEEQYNSRSIEKELLTHELAHVRQKHTLDILFIELLQIVFWFNPLLILYKKAIQLNHEFMADRQVLSVYQNITDYQALLLSKTGLISSTLTNNFNYLITKKRLIMMTKNVNQGRAVCKQLAVLPLLAASVLLFSTKAQAKIEVIPSRVMPESGTTISHQSAQTITLAESKVQPKVLSVGKEKKRSRALYSSPKTLRNAALYPVKTTSRLAFVEVLPEFPGGTKKFQEYISSSTQHNGIPGTVEVTFQVEKNGQVVIPATWNNTYKQNEISLREAIANSLNWKPAIQNGRLTPVNYVMTVSFTNNNNLNVIKVDKIAIINDEMIVSFETKNENDKAFVQGTILDKDGKPVPGVSIRTAGYEYGGISSRDGKFVVELPELKTLIFSCIGYSTRRLNF